MILVNGVETDYIKADDRGLLYGDGLFETVAVKDSQPKLLEMHFQRLKDSATRLSIQGFDTEAIAKDIDLIVSKSGLHNAVVRITVTRGSGDRGYASLSAEANVVISISPFPEYIHDKRSSGITAVFSSVLLDKESYLAGVKHLNRLTQVLVANEAAKKGVDEALVLSEDGQVVEGGKSNVFFVFENQIKTPRLDEYGVAGIMRRRVIDVAPVAGYEVVEANINLDDLLDVKEVFVTNSIIGIWPVYTLNERVFSQFTCAKKLQQLLAEDMA
ncbi:MAG: aminodeoxychorismate lyase [Gammaproteobacteria bacterium]|nr:MAG: aminodeoxychorismate lyase [Gammaproteobacteria bacterium]